MYKKISPISYKFKTKTAISASPKYFFTPNHWAHGSIWYEFQELSKSWDSNHYSSLWDLKTENVDSKISPNSYKFKTKTEISESSKYYFTQYLWAHESILNEIQELTQKWDSGNNISRWHLIQKVLPRKYLQFLSSSELKQQFLHPQNMFSLQILENMDLYDMNSKSNRKAEIPITTYHFEI